MALYCEFMERKYNPATEVNRCGSVFGSKGGYGSDLRCKADTDPAPEAGEDPDPNSEMKALTLTGVVLVLWLRW